MAANSGTNYVASGFIYRLNSNRNPKQNYNNISQNVDIAALDLTPTMNTCPKNIGAFL